MPLSSVYVSAKTLMAVSSLMQVPHPLTTLKLCRFNVVWITEPATDSNTIARLVVIQNFILFFSTGHASDKTHYKGPYDCLKSIYRQHGIRGWYKGLVPMAWR